MENEKYFTQHIEQPESEPKIYIVRFDETHFDGQEIDPRTLELQIKFFGAYNWLPEAATQWWTKICLENNLNPKEKKLQNLMLHFIEVARNAYEKVGSGELQAIFEPKRITLTVRDQGEGFGDSDDVNYAMAMGHGLSKVKKYADEFIIETNGKKYIKTKGRSKLMESQDTDIQRGLKITFVKNFK